MIRGAPRAPGRRSVLGRPRAGMAGGAKHNRCVLQIFVVAVAFFALIAGGYAAGRIARLILRTTALAFFRFPLAAAWVRA